MSDTFDAVYHKMNPQIKSQKTKQNIHQKFINDHQRVICNTFLEQSPSFCHFYERKSYDITFFGPLQHGLIKHDENFFSHEIQLSN